MIVRHFDSSKPVVLLTDASRLFGLGYALGHLERDFNGKDVFKIVRCGSKGLTPTQQRYSTIELECLAIVWAIQKCAFFLLFGADGSSSSGGNFSEGSFRPTEP